MATMIREACDGIVAKADERLSWFKILAVLGEFPLSESAQTALEGIVPTVSLVDYLDRDPWLAIAALGVVGTQAKHLSTGVRARIESQLLDLAGRLSHVTLDTEVQETLSDSILAGLIGCTWWQSDGEVRSVALAKLLERLAMGESSPVFARSGPFILRLCEMLPSRQARHFWRARDLLRLRRQL